MRVGDLGWMFHRRAVVYREEFGYGGVFEGYLADGLLRFLRHHDPRKDRVWVAESAGRTVGFVAVHHARARPGWAWLRWLFVEEEFRRRGAGTRLMRAASSFCRRAGYKGVFLWTLDDLDAARRLFERTGFVVAAEKDDCAWSPGHREQRWELRLG